MYGWEQHEVTPNIDYGISTRNIQPKAMVDQHKHIG